MYRILPENIDYSSCIFPVIWSHSLLLFETDPSASPVPEQKPTKFFLLTPEIREVILPVYDNAFVCIHHQCCAAMGPAAIAKRALSRSAPAPAETGPAVRSGYGTPSGVPPGRRCPWVCGTKASHGTFSFPGHHCLSSWPSPDSGQGLLRQLKKTEPAGFFIRATRPGKAQKTYQALNNLRDSAESLESDTSNTAVTTLEIIYDLNPRENKSA